MRPFSRRQIIRRASLQVVSVVRTGSPLPHNFDNAQPQAAQQTRAPSQASLQGQATTDLRQRSYQERGTCASLGRPRSQSCVNFLGCPDADWHAATAQHCLGLGRGAALSQPCQKWLDKMGTIGHQRNAKGRSTERETGRPLHHGKGCGCCYRCDTNVGHPTHATIA
jgi:hypothetical protein